MMAQDEWWTYTMHVIDSGIWRFQTDSTGFFSERFTYNDNDPYGVESYPMTYGFDVSTLTWFIRDNYSLYFIYLAWLTRFNQSYSKEHAGIPQQRLGGEVMYKYFSIDRE